MPESKVYIGMVGIFMLCLISGAGTSIKGKTKFPSEPIQAACIVKDSPILDRGLIDSFNEKTRVISNSIEQTNQLTKNIVNQQKLISQQTKEMAGLVDSFQRDTTVIIRYVCDTPVKIERKTFLGEIGNRISNIFKRKNPK